MTDDDEVVIRELMLNRFRRLMGEVLREQVARNSFEPWEIEVLTDLHECDLERRRRAEILRQYQRAVEKQIETGPGPPMKLSEYLILRVRRGHTGQS